MYDIVSQRIILILNNLGVPKRQIAKQLGVSAQGFGEALRKKKLSKRLIDEIIGLYPDALEVVYNTSEPDVEYKPRPKGSVPYYDIDVTATAEMFLGQERETTDTYIMIPGFEDCTGWVNVYGDSMYPAYASGEVIAIKEVKNKEVILWGEAYLVVTDELRTIKKLKKSKDGDQYIDLEPSNPNFQTTTIKRSEVVKLYIIKGKLKRTL